MNGASTPVLQAGCDFKGRRLRAVVCSWDIPTADDRFLLPLRFFREDEDMTPAQGSAIVARVNTAHPQLLKANTPAACGEFIQRVANEPECKAERVGLLSKSAGENGYTYPNGKRAALDVIAWPNGERVDIIQSSGGAPAPGGPTWQVIPPDQWRPSNVWIDISGWPIFDSGTPTTGPTNPMIVAFGWFCWMTAWADWPLEAQQNLDWILGEVNPSVFRVMLAVEGRSHGSPDPWRDAGVSITTNWEDRFKRMLDQLGQIGRRAHCTVYGGRNQTPNHDDRRRFHDRIVAAAQGRWQAIRSWEMMNEFKVNKWEADEVKAAGRDLSSKLPRPYLLALSSPNLAHGYVDGGGGVMRPPTNEEMQASFDELYGDADHAGANEITIHTMRDGLKWSDPFAFNIFYPSLPKINNEPPGPGTSAGGEGTTAENVRRDLTRTRDAGWRMYVGHAEWCPWNGHLPQEYHNGYREVRFVKDLPHMPGCAAELKALSDGTNGGDMPLPDRGKVLSLLHRVHKFYKAPEGLQRPDGLELNGEPDFEGIATWGFDVGLKLLQQGKSEDDAFAEIKKQIEMSDEWKTKHPAA